MIIFSENEFVKKFLNQKHQKQETEKHFSGSKILLKFRLKKQF